MRTHDFKDQLLIIRPKIEQSLDKKGDGVGSQDPKQDSKPRLSNDRASPSAMLGRLIPDTNLSDVKAAALSGETHTALSPPIPATDQTSDAAVALSSEERDELFALRAQLEELRAKLSAFSGLAERESTIVQREDYVLEEDARLGKIRAEILAAQVALTSSLEKHDEELSQLRHLSQRELAVTKREDENKSKNNQLAKRVLALDSKEQRLVGREKDIAQKEAIVTGAIEELGDLRKKARKLARVSRDLLVRTEELAESEGAVEKLKDRQKSTLAVLRAVRLELSNAHIEIEGKSDHLARVEKQFEEVRRQLAKSREDLANLPEFRVSSFSTVAWMVEHFKANEQDVFPSQVLLIGEGPWNSTEITGLLSNAGFEVWNGGYSEDIEVVIVGRENWSGSDLVAQVAGRENRPLRIYPQELFVLALALGMDPLDTAEVDMLMHFVRGHSAFDFLFSQDFPWPEHEPLTGEPRHFDGRGADQSPLFLLDYSVAQNRGLRPSERRAILAEAYETEHLPWTESDEYMEEWGAGATRQRLKRIAWHLHLLSRRNQHHAEATAKWEADLAWLRNNYYRPMQRFNWPS